MIYNEFVFCFLRKFYFGPNNIFPMGIQGLSVQFAYDDLSIMVRVVQYQHGGFAQSLIQDLANTVISNSIDEWIITILVDIPYFTPMVSQSGSFIEPYSREMFQFMRS